MAGFAQAEEGDPPEGCGIEIEAAEAVRSKESLNFGRSIRVGQARQVLPEDGYVDGGHHLLLGHVQAFPAKAGPQGRMSRGDELPRGHQPRHVDGLGQRHIQLLDVDPGVCPPFQIVKKHALLERGEKVGALRFCNHGQRVVLSAQSVHHPSRQGVR